MTTEIRCAQCGAPFRAEEERFCSYCGTQRPRPAGAPAQSAPDRAERFAAAKAQPVLQELMRREPSSLGYWAQGIVGLAFLVFFCIVAAAVAKGFSLVGTAFSALPLAILAVGLFLLIALVVRLGRFHSSALVRQMARVADERTEVSGGENAHTTYYTTLEWEDGSRTEYETDGRLAGKIARDDIGLAYLKSDVLLDFQRLKV